MSEVLKKIYSVINELKKVSEDVLLRWKIDAMSNSIDRLDNIYNELIDAIKRGDMRLASKLYWDMYGELQEIDMTVGEIDSRLAGEYMELAWVLFKDIGRAIQENNIEALHEKYWKGIRYVVRSMAKKVRNKVNRKLRRSGENNEEVAVER